MQPRNGKGALLRRYRVADVTHLQVAFLTLPTALPREKMRTTRSDDQLECAVITLQNWWRDMLATKLDWESSSSEGGRAPGMNKALPNRRVVP